MDQDVLRRAYDPDYFREQGHQLIDQLADYLQAQQDPASAEKAIPYQAPEEAYKRWSLADFRDAPLQLLNEVLQEGVRVQNPRYMGHQISPPLPMTALAGLVSDFLNNGMGVYEMGIPGTALERKVVKTLAPHFGFDDRADGMLTSGGTLGNMTALLTARSVKARGRIWEAGADSVQPMALLVSEEAHYCVDRAVRIMGWGAEGIIKVPTDAERRMRTELLPDLYEDAVARGRQVIAVVGSACSTSTGAYDDLSAIADFCETKNLWLHVDGAHGAAAVFSRQYRGLVRGIERADSVIVDFHKMLLTPAITTALLYRNGQHSFQTFAQRAQYLWERESDQDWFNLAKRTFECTKAMYSLRAYITLHAYSTELLDTYVTGAIDLGRRFATLIEEQPDLELASAPQCNIVCFRYRPVGLSNEACNAWNDRIRQQLLEEGHYYVVKTSLQGITYLRCTLTNPFTTAAHLQALLQRIEELAGEVAHPQ